ncbi:MAG: helix-turn-helix transcriptional regulator [Thermoleophilia bacterium]|nr:helix-turn-helix transcriptional regulator [Thermoleophilia bacterium]
MKENANREKPCHVLHELLEVLARPWTLHILCVLNEDGPVRFGVLRRKIDGISSRVLTERLRSLEAKGFVFRHYKPTVPPAVTYGLTERVQDLKQVMTDLERLAKTWAEEDVEEPADEISA